MPTTTLARPGSSTIIQPVGSQTRPTIVTRALVVFKKLTISEADVANPKSLLSLFGRLQDAIATAVRPIGQSPLVSCNLLQGLVFTGGQTLNVAHGLGRPWRGYICTRAQGNAPAFTDQPLPVGTSSSLVLPLQTPNSGTYDLLVF